MTDQEARYDRIAEGYAAWWSPIHRPATLAVLDEIEPVVAAGATRLLDVGAGTGALAAAAVTRWPGVSVTGVDASAGMLAVAERELGGLPAGDRARISLVHAPADTLPFGEGAFDVAISTFVLQLVPSAHRALREARRVLVPGGTVAVAVWLAGGSVGGDDAYREALLAAGHEPADGGGGGDDPASPDEAARRLRRAGFGNVTARATAVAQPFTPDSYLAFVSRFDDEDLWTSLDADERARLEADLRARLEGLGPDGLRMWLPVGVATGRRTRRR